MLIDAVLFVLGVLGLSQILSGEISWRGIVAGAICAPLLWRINNDFFTYVNNNSINIALDILLGACAGNCLIYQTGDTQDANL